MPSDNQRKFFAQKLGHEFSDPDLLDRALTHSSTEGGSDNERLEFLGDRVLGLVIAELLLAAFPDENEGDIGRRFAQLVRSKTLTEVGRDLGIDNALNLAGSVATDNVVADATEAVIAAIYLDGGFNAAQNFISCHWQPRIAKAGAPPQDAKTALQEWSQARRLALPKYRVIAREGPDHEPRFTVEVVVADNPPIQAQGASKRAAEQQAASALLAMLEDKDDA